MHMLIDKYKRKQAQLLYCSATSHNPLFKRNMVYYYFTLVLFQVTAHMAAGVPADCGQTYQNTLKSLLTQKENCDTAGFKECCQVHTCQLCNIGFTSILEIGFMIL